MQRMRDLLRSSLSRSLDTLSPQDRLAAAWPVACGSALAARGHVLSLSDEGVLHVGITDPAWLAQFIDMRSTLQQDLGRIAGVRLGGIHFENVSRAQPTSSPKSRS
jgi:Dna[CI] antecedent, DciA